jgi:hypothetical protein
MATIQRKFITAIGQHWSMMSAMLFFMEFVDMASRVCNKWRYEMVVAYMKNQLLGSFFEKMFRQQMKLSYDTFCSLQLIKVVGSSLVQKNTHMRY